MGILFAHRNLAETIGTEVSTDSEATGLGVRSLLTPQIADVYRSAPWGPNGAVNLRLAFPAPIEVRLILLAAPRDGVLPPAGCTVRVTGSLLAADGTEALDTGGVAFSLAPWGLWAVLLPAPVTLRWLRLRFLAGTEPPASNLVRNPLFTGGTAGVVGSGGAWPTNMSLSNPGSITTTLDFGVEAAMRYMEVRLQTSAAVSSRIINFDTTSGLPLVGGATYTASVLARLAAGSLSGWSTVGLRRRTNAATAANGTLVNLATMGATPAQVSVTEAVAADAATGNTQFVFTAPSGADATIRFYYPALEAGAVASPPYTVTDPPNPGYLQLGRLWVGPAIVTERAVSYGWARGGTDTGSNDRAPLSGTRYGRRGAVLRRASMPITLMTEAEGEALFAAMLVAGTTAQVFAAPFASRLAATGLLGSLADLPDLGQPYFQRTATALNIVEDR